MIDRKEFIKMGALTVLATLGSSMVRALPFDGAPGQTDDALMARLIAANDKAVTEILKQPVPSKQNFSRRMGQNMAKIAAVWVSPTSQYYHSSELAERMFLISNILLSVQSADGTVSIGNLESPPDTAFLLESLTAAAYILQKEKDAEQINKNLKSFLLKSGEGLITGGVHTPNHRWVISAALARLNRLYPDKRYVARIDEWLAEGVFIDKDGHYPERSAIYSNVENTAFITMGRLLNRPQLFEPVKKNLTMMYYYMEPNGDMVTFDSRRQDQYMSEKPPNYYLAYRFAANHFNNPFFAGIARQLEMQPDFENRIVVEGLYHFLDDEILQRSLPESSPLPVNFEKLFSTSSLLRIRRNATTVTLFGGTDKPIEIASGRSNSPNIFSYRKGDAVLKYLRLSASFFSTGYFYSDGIVKQGNGYLLQSKFEAPYYQPLPKNKQKPNGDYALTPSTDGRFWNKMDFKNRPVSNVKTLQTKVLLQENDGKCQLHFMITGLAGVNVTIELCFKEGGKLEGQFKTEGDNNFLEAGIGTYQSGDSKISFGPGRMEHNNLKGLEGERYSIHFGSLRTDGMHVYITGITPFDYAMDFI